MMKNGELAQSHEVLPEVLRSMAFSEDISRQQAGAKHSLWQTEMTCSLHVVYSNNVQPCWPRLRHLDSCGKICPPTASNPFHSLSKDQGASVALWDPESTWLKKWRFATWAGRFAADSLWASDLENVWKCSSWHNVCFLLDDQWSSLLEFVSFLNKASSPVSILMGTQSNRLESFIVTPAHRHRVC